MILLSIFPRCKALPSKAEKSAEARFSSKPYKPEIREIRTEEDLIEIVTSHSWSPSIFSGFRNQSNFLRTDLMVLDIDSGMTIDEAGDIAEKLELACLCLPSTSHTEENHRFRLIFPLSGTIRNKADFTSTMLKLAEHFPADPACIGDTARFFFGCNMDAGFWLDGELLEPVIAPEKVGNRPQKRPDTAAKVRVGSETESVVERLYGEKREKIPEAVDYFIREAHTGIPGMWHNSANAFLFVLALQDVDFDVISEVFEELAPDGLDSNDQYLLERSTTDGYEARDLEEEL